VAASRQPETVNRQPLYACPHSVHDPILDRHVALKVITANDEERQQRFAPKLPRNSQPATRNKP
jgi:hypothetical protein